MARHKFKQSFDLTYIKMFFITSIIFLLCISILTILYHFKNVKNEEQTCYNILLDVTEEANSKIENSFNNDIVSLRMLSKVIAKYDNLKSEDVNNQLTAYAVNSYITNIALLTEDNSIIQTRYKTVYDDRIVYDDEIIKGEHTSSLQKSAFSNNLVIRNYVPVKSRTNKGAILFTEMDPITLARSWRSEIYDNHADFCIIDSTNGQIIMSTLNTSFDNIAYFNDTTLINEVKNKQTNYKKVNIDNSSYLAAYRPMSIEKNWEIMFIVEENIVMQPMKNLKKASYLFLSIGATILILYLTWTIFYTLKILKLTKVHANMDALTGLENRNNYEEFCYKAKNTNGLSCIYIDVNGLHTINNEKGHLAGDMMLRYIAETFKIYFNDSKIYRIGGDEFVIFNQNNNNEEMITKAYNDIRNNGYHISYGIKVGDTDLHISDLIKQSEILMYEMKTKYYESIGQPVRNKIGDS